MRKTLFVSLFFLSCHGDPISDDPASAPRPPIVREAEPSMFLTPPRAAHVRPLSGEPVSIYISSLDISVNKKVVAVTAKMLSDLVTSPTMLLTSLAEEMEIQKQKIIASGGREKFDRRVRIYADKTTNARLLWSAAYSAAAVGFDLPEFVVLDSDGRESALALTQPEKGFFRGVYLEQDGANAPELGPEPLNFMTNDREKLRPSYGYNSGAEVIDGKAAIQGKVKREDVEESLGYIRSGIRYCYQKALPNNPTLNGKVEVSFTLFPTGNVASAELKSAPMRGGVGECVVLRIKEAHFWLSEGEGEIQVQKSYTFQTPGNEYDPSRSPETQPIDDDEALVVALTPKNITLVTWPSYVPIKEIPNTAQGYDLEALSQSLQGTKSSEVIVWWFVGDTFERVLSVMEVCLQAKPSAISLPPPSLNPTF